jgi:hypothetical protein
MDKDSGQGSVVSGQTFARYTGDGAFFDGVPARDLTREEWDAVPRVIRDAIVSSKLYELTDSQNKRAALPRKETNP